MVSLSLEFEFRNKRYKDAEKGLTAFAKSLQNDWDGAAKTLSRELMEFLKQVASALESRHGGAWPGATGEQTLSRRSGALVDAIVNSVTVKGTTFQTIEGTIGADVKYAAIQEFGGTIKPKGKYLAIPLPAALNANGTPKKAGPREWKNTFVAMSKNGNLIIFLKEGAGITPLYVLKTSVTIPPRLGMRKTLDAGLPYFVDKAMDAMVRDVLAAKASA